MSESQDCQLKKCGQCGTSFECTANTGKCWCFEHPPVLRLLDTMDCLCPQCLKERIESVNQRNTLPPRRSV